MMLPKLENPWNVESLYAFQYFQCPACEFKDGKKQDFLNHAYEYHPESTHYLSIITDGSLKDVLCPWNDSPENENEFIGIEDHDIEDFKTDDVTIKDAEYIPEDGNKKIIAIIKDEEIDTPQESIIEKEFDNYFIPLVNYETSDSSTTVMCYHCSFELIYSEIRAHIENEHPGKEVIYFPTNSVKTNDEVENAIHEAEFQCDTFTQAGKKHFKLVHGPKDHKCESCGKSFSEARKLKRHIRENHEGHKDHKCESCGKSFFRADNLKRHIQTVHEGQNDHKCKLCGKTYTTKQKMKDHVKAIHEQLNVKPHKCDSCGRTFGRPDNLRRHVKAVHDGSKKSSLDEDVKTNQKISGKEFRCAECGKSFASKNYLKIHKKDVHGEKKFHCTKSGCEYRCTSSERLRHHVMSIHEGLRPHQCDTCGKAFLKEKSLEEHIKVFHTDQRDYPCNQCEKAFALKSRLRVHLKEVHGGNVYICEICSCAFSSTNGLKNHVKRFHEGDKSDMVVCPQCGKSMRNNYLNTHTRIVHEGIKDAKCEICGKLFSVTNKLKMHMLSVHEDKKDHTCEACGMCFSQISSLKRHIQRIHEKRKDVKCDHCSKFFFSTVDLKQHILWQHVDDKHRCETCGNSFAEISELQRHMERNHSGNQLNCDCCGKTFPHEKALMTHVNNDHTAKKLCKMDYECVSCGKHFKRPHHLRRHIAAIHEGRKDFKCDQCEKQFSENGNLRQHIDTVHKGIKRTRGIKDTNSSEHANILSVV